MPTIGPLELVVLLIIALVVLGPKKLPDAGRSAGRSLREFKDALSGSDLSASPGIEPARPSDDAESSSTDRGPGP